MYLANVRNGLCYFWDEVSEDWISWVFMSCYIPSFCVQFNQWDLINKTIFFYIFFSIAYCILYLFRNAIVFFYALWPLSYTIELSNFLVQFGATLFGLVDENGILTGDDVTYVYPDNETALRGRFQVSSTNTSLILPFNPIDL